MNLIKIMPYFRIVIVVKIIKRDKSLRTIFATICHKRLLTQPRYISLEPNTLKTKARIKAVRTKVI